MLRLRRWSNDHPECKPLVVTYYGAMNPGTLSFEPTGVPMTFLPPEEFGAGGSSGKENRGPLYWAISSTILNGLLANVLAENGYFGQFVIDSPALRPENAMTQVGHTIFIFRIAGKREAAGRSLTYEQVAGCLRRPTELEARTHASP